MTASGLLDKISGDFQPGGGDDGDNDQHGIGNLVAQTRKLMFGQAVKRGGLSPSGDLENGQGSCTLDSVRRAQKNNNTVQQPAAAPRYGKTHKGKERAHSVKPAEATSDSRGRIIDEAVHGEEDEAYLTESPADSPDLFGLRVGPEHSL